MKCPACDQSLHEVDVQGINLDVCDDGCRGIWFDNFELSKVKDHHESAGENLLDIRPADRDAPVANGPRACPKCDGQKLTTHLHAPTSRVQVDECPTCGGVWLDCGEFAAIRSQFADEDSRREATREYFSKIFDDQLDKMRQESEENADRAQKLAVMSRLVGAVRSGSKK